MFGGSSGSHRCSLICCRTRSTRTTRGIVIFGLMMFASSNTMAKFVGPTASVE